MKKVMVVLAVMAFSVTAIAASYAADNAGAEAVKKVVEYPAKLVKESAVAVGDTAKAGATTVADTASAAGGVMTGDGEKVKDLVLDPITGTYTTAATAVKETVEAPVKAAQ